MSNVQPDKYEPTGSTWPERHSVTRNIGQYEVHFEMTKDGRILGIVGFSMKRDFRSQRQRIDSLGSHDVLDIYLPER